jgi:hypothetical protein
MASSSTGVPAGEDVSAARIAGVTFCARAAAGQAAAKANAAKTAPKHGTSAIRLEAKKDLRVLEVEKSGISICKQDCLKVGCPQGKIS